MNKLPVLDKGYVALFSNSMGREQFLSVQTGYFRGMVHRRILSMPMIHMEIKCPLFVQLYLTESLNAVARRSSAPEAFIPAINDVAAGNLETSEVISKDIEQTTKALLLNPKSYQMDGCDIFISQVISPISVYNTLMVNGTLDQWILAVKGKSLPAPIEQYRKAIEDVLLAEYDFLREHIVGKKTEKRKRNR